ncbi:MAG: MFS transporter [Acidimicrobiia bacterium]|nr:MFS transporter [Acidimicrobiia bacterium]
MTATTTAPSQLPIADKRRLAFVFYAAVLLEGIMLASIGPTLDALSDKSGSTTGQISILVTVNSIGYITGSLLAGRLYARLRGNAVLAVALVWMAVLTATIPALGSLGLMIGAFTLIGLSIGLIDVGGNTLLVWLFRRDVHPYMNALHLCFGIGAFLCPLIVDRFAVAAGDATDAFFFFAALMIPVAIWLTRVPSPDSPPETSSPAAGSGLVRRYAVFLGLMGVLFFMHVGGELAFGGWIFSYADELDIGGSTTARVLNSAFWGGLVVGRLIAIPLSRRMSPRAMLQLDLVSAIGFLAVIGLLPDWPPALWIGTIGFGMALASVFATCINYAEQRIPLPSQVMAVFMVGGSIGSMTLPWVAGQLFDRRGPETLIWLVGGAIVVALALFITVDRTRTAKVRSA